MRLVVVCCVASSKRWLRSVKSKSWSHPLRLPFKTRVEGIHHVSCGPNLPRSRHHSSLFRLCRRNARHGANDGRCGPDLCVDRTKSPRRIMSQSAFRALLSQDKDNLTLSARAARPIGRDLHCKANARGSPVNGTRAMPRPSMRGGGWIANIPAKKKAIRTKYTNFARQEFTNLSWAFIAAPAA